MTNNKFGAIRTKIDGYSFDSLAEAQRYLDLCLLVKAGEIFNLRIHPVYELQKAFEYHGKKLQAIKYEADFQYIEGDQIVTEDVKGIITALAKVKIKMFKKLYNWIDFRIVK